MVILIYAKTRMKKDEGRNENNNKKKNVKCDGKYWYILDIVQRETNISLWHLMKFPLHISFFQLGLLFLLKKYLVDVFIQTKIIKTKHKN